MELRPRRPLPAGTNGVSGGTEFYLWCCAADARAKARRSLISRGWKLYKKSRRGGDPYPGALVLGQRLGVALEDLGRLLVALEADDRWSALRGARVKQLDEIYDNLVDDPQRCRRVLQLPDQDSLADAKLPDSARSALLRAADLSYLRWHRQLVGCASSWLLVRRLAKSMRHGSPLLPRPLVEGPPGAGDLGSGVQSLDGPWVMLIPTQANVAEPPYTTQRELADLRHETLHRCHQSTLDGVALVRTLAGLHVTRMDTGSLIALPKDALLRLRPDERNELLGLQRG